MITKEKYNFLVNKYGKTSSFAIWGDCVSDMTVFDKANKPWEKLNAAYVVVALNPAGEISGCLENFHSPDKKHADERLMMGIRNTILEGSFMTDLSATKTPNSNEVYISEADADLLISKLKDIGNVKTIVLLTSKTPRIDRYFFEKGYRVFRMLHYSRANGNAIKKYCLKNNITGDNSYEMYAMALKKQIFEMEDSLND